MGDQRKAVIGKVTGRGGVVTALDGTAVRHLTIQVPAHEDPRDDFAPGRKVALTRADPEPAESEGT